MKMWLAREKSGALGLHTKSPSLFFEEGIGEYWTGPTLYLPYNEHPEVTFENSPKEVELVIKK